ncbi:MAG TPA: VOC family protein [Euzebyales bacterium]|nr:VOC family protein [Euzebyales bacterium]
MSEQQIPKNVWPCLNYDDAQAAITFLVDAFGFREAAVYHDDRGRVSHAELRWPEGGAIMLGDAGRDESEFSQMPTGCAALYVVTDEPDAVYGRAVAAGAEVVRELREEDYGSQGFSVRDPERNIWSFGTYRGA